MSRRFDFPAKSRWRSIRVCSSRAESETLSLTLIAQYRDASPCASNHAFANDGRVVSNFIVQAVKAGRPKLPIWIL